MNDDSVAVSQQPKVGETPEQKFRRIATRRTRAILKYLRLLGNTAKPHYKFSTHEVDAIFSALKKALADTEARFLIVDEDSFRL